MGAVPRRIMKAPPTSPPLLASSTPTTTTLTTTLPQASDGAYLIIANQFVPITPTSPFAVAYRDHQQIDQAARQHSISNMGQTCWFAVILRLIAATVSTAWGATTPDNQAVRLVRLLQTDPSLRENETSHLAPVYTDKPRAFL
eukprot:gb/GEZN01017458.1/.p1 GENE.gb/GEZN01017458.1/~~gb/GEZN01017458.1/.p1  ORF type:complete len:143 (-),score=2.41 gb/GEZN01017458.1/:347-775(-)